MPIYEYRCKTCGRTTEVIQKVDDKPLRKCADCSGPLEKLISRTSFQLKGGGWYMQSYDKGASSSKTSESSAGSSETKPETKSEKKGSGGCGPGCGCH